MFVNHCTIVFLFFGGYFEGIFWRKETTKFVPKIVPKIKQGKSQRI